MVDDEPKAIDLLRRYIDQLDILVLKKTFRNPFKAFHYLSTEDVDLLYLDINMPQLSGLELLNNLSRKPNVIFTTAHAEYAVDAFELDAIDYLLKPITYSRFEKSVHKFLKSDFLLQKTEYLISDPLYVKSGNTVYSLLWTDVKFLQKSENYVTYHLKDGRRILSRATLSEVEELFPSYVIRIHRSFAVCLYNVTVVETNRILFHDLGIPIGRKFKDNFYEKYEVRVHSNGIN